MPQFTVYKNPGRNEDIPFVVQGQSTRLDQSVGRLIVPLVRVGHSALRDHALTPHLVVMQQVVFADVLNMATLFKARLGEPLLLLDESDQDRIIQAIDEMICRAYTPFTR